MDGVTVMALFCSPLPTPPVACCASSVMRHLVAPYLESRMPVAPPPLPGKMMTRTMLLLPMPPPLTWEKRCFASAAEEWKGSTTSRQSGWVHQISVPRVMSPRSMPWSTPCEIVQGCDLGVVLYVL